MNQTMRKDTRLANLENEQKLNGSISKQLAKLLEAIPNIEE